MEKIHENMHVLYMKVMKTCMFYTWKDENTNVFMYFLHLVPTFPPHYIVVEKGLLAMTLETCSSDLLQSHKPLQMVHSKKKLVNLIVTLVAVVANWSIGVKLCSVACPTRE